MSLRRSSRIQEVSHAESSSQGSASVPTAVKKKRKASVASSASTPSAATQRKGKKKRKMDFAKVFAMGSNNEGQLGLGIQESDVTQPTMVTDLLDEDIIDIACGDSHVLAMASSGKLFSWGSNDHGALGRATVDADSFTPRPVQGLSKVSVTQIAAGSSFSMALGSKGEVYFWGALFDHDGEIQLDQDTAMHDRPILVDGLENVKIEAIAAGDNHCLAMAGNGDVYAWGASDDHQLGRFVGVRHKAQQLVPIKVTSKMRATMIAAGYHHSLVLTKKNKLFAWGLNDAQQCGLMSSMTSKPKGNYITHPKEIKSLPDGEIASIQAGHRHSLVVMADGTVFTFGRAGPSLGLPETQIEKLQALRGDSQDTQDTQASQQTAISEANEEIDELQSDSEPDNKDAVPDEANVVPDEKKVVVSDEKDDIVSDEKDDIASDEASVASTSQATANKDNEGLEATDNGKKVAADKHKEALKPKKKPKHTKKSSLLMDIGVPVPIPGLEDVASVACGREHSLAVLEDGSCYAWGQGEKGQLGQDDNDDRYTPVLITGEDINDMKVVRADAGAQFTILLAE
ncbi:regulator of chromosome condensation 1/beta-lactamase-inhibitor protein II [Gongronella butleri]|nr:regulator of chromosome condensation 1/beta-lactamase-inhibitor protein II [Gongronella butleri]